LVALKYGTPGLIRTTCALVAQGERIEIAFIGLRARLLGLALPVARFLNARAHDLQAGEEPGTLAFLSGVAILVTLLMPFTRILVCALSNRRQLTFAPTEDGILVAM
jgi:hypothetical protein